MAICRAGKHRRAFRAVDGVEMAFTCAAYGLSATWKLYAYD